MAYDLGELGEELDAGLNRKLDRHARSPDLVAKFLRLTSAGGSEEAVISLAASIVEEHLGEGKYPDLADYAEAVRDCYSRMRGNAEEKPVDGPSRGEPSGAEDKWLIMAAEILAVKVASFCREEGLVALDERNRG